MIICVSHTHTHKLDYEILGEKKFLCIIFTDVLEFIATKFDNCSTFYKFVLIEKKFFLNYIVYIKC